MTPELRRLMTARVAYQAAQLASSQGRAGREDVDVARVEVERAERAVRSARDAVVEWRPPNARHVVGRWERRRMGEDGMPEPQTIVCECAVCGATWRGECTSGLVRQHVQRFALVHAHRDSIGGRERA